MSYYDETFDADENWQAAGGHVDATKSITGGQLTLTAVTDSTTSLWTRTGFSGSDVIVIAVTNVSSGDPQVHVRETDENNFLTAYIDSAGGNFVIAKRVSGSTTTLATEAITDFSTANSYTILVKVFGNALHAILLDENEDVLIHHIEVSSDVSDQSGTLAGLGTGGTAVYDSAKLRTVTEMINVVCLGDSNTDGNNIANADEFPWLLNSQNAFFPIVFINSGKAGDNIAECQARIATEVAPYYVAGHRNVSVLQMGTNDRADGFTAAQSWARYQEVIRDVKQAGFEAIVGTGFPNTKTDPTKTQWNEDLNADIMSDERIYGYTAVDIWTAYGGVLGSGEPPDISRDWVSANNPHASEYGHQVFATTYLKAIISPAIRLFSSNRSAATGRTLSSERTVTSSRTVTI